MQAGAGALALLRCTSCSDQQWAHDGAVVPRNTAFDMLASAYREVPLRARAVRDRAAAANAARQAARLADKRAAHDAMAAPEAQPDAARLIAMLHGWQVLGATA